MTKHIDELHRLRRKYEADYLRAKDGSLDKEAAILGIRTINLEIKNSYKKEKKDSQIGLILFSLFALTSAMLLASHFEGLS